MSTFYQTLMKTNPWQFPSTSGHMASDVAFDHPNMEELVEWL
jgi:hypothetical protein